MFGRFRRLFAIWLDGIVLFPLVFTVSMWLYNQVIHFGGLNMEVLQFVVELNRYSVLPYILLLFPVFYVVYEIICYLIFKRTMGQYFMQISMAEIDSFAFVLRAFFALVLHVMTLGVFSVVNVIVLFMSKRTLIDWLSRSQPIHVREQGSPWQFLGIIGMTMATILASLGVAVVWQANCFEFSCVEKVILKDAIDQQNAKTQLQLESYNQQTLRVLSYSYEQLQAIFPESNALQQLQMRNQQYDFFEVALDEDLQVYTTATNERMSLLATQTLQFLMRKDPLSQQNWQLYLWSNEQQQFLPVRSVFTIHNENNYQWAMNVMPLNQANTQWQLVFSHDVGGVSQIYLEK